MEAKRQPTTELPLNGNISFSNDHKDNSQVCQMCGYTNIAPIITKTSNICSNHTTNLLKKAKKFIGINVKNCKPTRKYYGK